MGQVGRRDRGGLENDVLAALAAAGRPLTPSEVLDGLGGALAYTTVMTTLARLHEKGVLGRARAGRAYAYAPVDPAERRAQQMRRLLEDGDRAAVLARFVDKLPSQDVPTLQRLLREAGGD